MAVERDPAALGRSLNRMGSAPRTLSDGRVRPSGVSRGRCALVVAIGILTILVGCSSGSSSTSSDSTTTTIEPSTPTPVYVDPATPISTPVGKEFEIMLPADPGSGWRWVLAPIDNTRLIALGSRFSDDAALLSKAASATTTTTAAAVRPGVTTSSTTTTVPAVFPLVQIISFAGRAIGPATISLSYNQIAGAPQAENKVLTFTVQVVGEPPTTTATTMATSTTALIPSTTSSTTTTTTKSSTTTR